MTVRDEIDAYIATLAPPKCDEVSALNQLILGVSPGARLWFLDGRNAEGKVVTNPNIGFGLQQMTYAGGETRDFYRVGLSANSTGISVYIMGLDDKTWLQRTYGDRLGKAKITGYCVKFRSVRDIDLDVLEAMIAERMSGA